MAIVDADMMMNAPKGLTSASGIDALVHSIEAYVSMMATEFTDGLAIEAIKTIFEYCQELMKKEQTTLLQEKKWQTQQRWQYGICKCFLRNMPFNGT